MTAAAGIRALLVSCHRKRRGLFLRGRSLFDIPFDDESERNKLLRQAGLRYGKQQGSGCSNGGTADFPAPLMGNTPQPLATARLCSTMEQTRAYHRSLYRLPVTYPAMYCVMSTVGEGTITNLSAVGCAIETDQPLLVDQDVALRLLLPDQLDSLPIELAHVRWANGKQAGIEFVQVEPTANLRLHGFVWDQMVQRVHTIQQHRAMS